MLSSRFVIPILLLAAHGALAVDENQPRFGDPGGQSPSRFVSQPGGSPYYQPAPFPKRNPSPDSRIMSAYRQQKRDIPTP